MKKSYKRLIYTAFSVIIAVVIGCGIFAYYTLYMPNFKPNSTKIVYIYEGDKDFDSLCQDLADSAACRNVKAFRFLAKLRKYPENMKSGRFAVEPNMSNNTLLNRLRRGQQEPVHLKFNNVRLINDLVERLTDQLMIDKEELFSYVSDEDYCESLGFDATTVKAMFIPNTYQVYWNISAENLLKRMKTEYGKFWNGDRSKKAESIRLTPVEVSILASIVEEETAIETEYPIVAGVYINRLYKGMLLQADPTVKYAVGDFSLQRILNKHLETDSPYNTYKYEGLPPGPIRIPSIKAIDAVLNYRHHNYLYMCAKEDFSGKHNFATTIAEHNKNADRYRAELNKRGIR